MVGDTRDQAQQSVHEGQASGVAESPTGESLSSANPAPNSDEEKKEQIFEAWDSLSPRAKNVLKSTGGVIGGLALIAFGANLAQQNEDDPSDTGAVSTESSDTESSILEEGIGPDTTEESQAEEETESDQSPEIFDSIPEEYLENNELVKNRIEQIIANNQSADKESKHIRELTITFWRGIAVKEIQTTDNERAFLRFENPLIVEVDRDSLYAAGYHPGTNELITFYMGHVVRGETMDNDNYLYLDRDRNETGWFDTYIYAEEGNEYSGMLVYMTPREISERGIFGRDDPAGILRDGPRDIYSTVSITKDEEEAHARIDRDRGREGQDGRLNTFRDEETLSDRRAIWSLSEEAESTQDN